MATLYLVRHGQASFGADDYDQLSDVGHRQSRLLGEYLADRGVRPARVMTGSLRRQRQTWQGMAEGLASRGIDCPDPVIRPGLDEYDAECLLAAMVASGRSGSNDGAGPASASPGSAFPVAGHATGPVASPVASPVAGHVGVPGDPADPEVRRAHFRLLRQVLTEWAHGRIVVADHRSWEAFRDGAVAALLEAWRGPTTAAPATASTTNGRAGTSPAKPDEDIIVVSSGGPIASILVGLLAMPPAGFVGLNLMARNTGCTEFLGNGRQPNLSSFNSIAHLDTPERRSLITYA